DKGGVKVYPTAKVELQRGAKFNTEFELLKGRVGEIHVDYTTICQARSVMEMTARINGSGEDLIEIKEAGHLAGEGARGVLTSRIAVSDYARAEVYNDLKASAPYTRGHVDCKEIIQGHGVARAIPVVEVGHPKAHVTHEAAIGSVDNKQLETLMARGLSEDDAVNLIIQGLLS
ncbi:SufBD protein, partial [candidate division KSB3 bacterium]|nr:SufBD protein [candidate division KSB3 bacterium]MBD3327570.1 SufBD protein [candidate division KSB3 bacterium]